jgi:GT2 family glycosyltransferase
MYKGKTVSVLVPIFNQYGLIPQFLKALQDSTVVPDCVVYFDNGLKIQNYLKEGDYPFKFEIYQPEKNMGTAIAWNYMIKNIGEERIIMNDDIFVQTDTIEKMVDTEGYVVACSKLSGINAFSCFLIRDLAINLVGYFDETISPNYCYFEDNDYVYRMKLLGVEVYRADCGADHYNGGSNTMKSLSPSRLQEHHLKFNYAKKRYITKWGAEPGMEIYTKPFNKE